MRMSNLVSQLKPYASDKDLYGRLSADFNDILEACEWLLAKEKETDSRVFSPLELENQLIEIDVKFIQHVSFHLKSLRSDLHKALEQFPDDA